MARKGTKGLVCIRRKNVRVKGHGVQKRCAAFGKRSGKKR